MMDSANQTKVHYACGAKDFEFYFQIEDVEENVWCSNELLVERLDPTVTYQQLLDLYSEFGVVKDIRVKSIISEMMTSEEDYLRQATEAIFDETRLASMDFMFQAIVKFQDISAAYRAMLQLENVKIRGHDGTYCRSSLPMAKTQILLGPEFARYPLFSGLIQHQRYKRFCQCSSKHIPIYKVVTDQSSKADVLMCGEIFSKMFSCYEEFAYNLAAACQRELYPNIIHWGATTHIFFGHEKDPEVTAKERRHAEELDPLQLFWDEFIKKLDFIVICEVSGTASGCLGPKVAKRIYTYIAGRSVNFFEVTEDVTNFHIFFRSLKFHITALLCAKDQVLRATDDGSGSYVSFEDENNNVLGVCFGWPTDAFNAWSCSERRMKLRCDKFHQFLAKVYRVVIFMGS